jgi:metal-responsive CopG/Arc/MetJ family transcriptional regulator
MTNSKTQRVNISLPKRVADELSALVPPGKRSHLIAEAIKIELQRIKMLKVLDRAAGAWSDANHPELKTISNVRSWVSHLRRSDEKRLAKLKRR